MRRLFPSQQTDETIFLVVREHWIFLVFRLFVVVLMFGLLLAFRRFGPAVSPGLFEGTAAVIVKLLSQLYLLALLVGLFAIWIFYYLNIQIITNIRIVDIDQKGLFRRVISELHIDKIEDVTSDANGILSTVFRFGNVYVQTAAAVERFEFDRVPKPEGIEKIILDLYEKRPQV